MRIDDIKFILCWTMIVRQYVIQCSVAYITYCPCMGRLGNQIEQFLGMIAFAIKLNRTLVLPPWNIMSSLQANFVPFGNLFNITTLLPVHQFVSLESFMLNEAPVIWPAAKRTALCFRPRSGPLFNDCNAKNGNPFKEFWDKFNVSFTGSSFYFPLSTDDPKEKWDQLFPSETYPVLAFIGPPSSFPVRPENRQFHRYLEWNSHINLVTENFINRWLNKPVVGVHLRNGEDFSNACSHLKSGLRILFSSAQCHGDFNELPPYKVTEDMCIPSKELVLHTISYGVRLIKAKTIYVSTDNDPMLSLIRRHFSDTTVKRVVWEPNRKPEEDLALLGRIDLAILNCVSTYSAAVKRERDAKNLPKDWKYCAIRQIKLSTTGGRNCTKNKFLVYHITTIVKLNCAGRATCNDLEDEMERSPVISVVFHLRTMMLITLLTLVDVYFIKTAYWKPATHGISVHLALGIEYFILILSLLSTTVRYILHSIDSMREHSWNKKATYLLYVDILIGFIRLAVYVEFTFIMWSLHPFPLFIARPIYLSIRSLKKAIRDMLMSRRAIRYMNTVFRDATPDDLASSSDTVCIICREEMNLQTDNIPSVGTSALKRLPCSHIFHFGCLRSWFQRQQTCPTCRMDVIREARVQERQRQQPHRSATTNNTQPESSTTSGPSNSTATPSIAANNQNLSVPWMPPANAFPFYPPFIPPTNNSTTTQAQTVFPSVPPLYIPPFMGMPIIYPGNLFSSGNTPMPEPPSGPPESTDEARLRASAEARFTALRQINVLLNAAVLQMNAYLNAASTPPSELEPMTSINTVLNTDDVGSNNEGKGASNSDVNSQLDSDGKSPLASVKSGSQIHLENNGF
ncbi:unnamed protein product [Schistosoma intercalatum]|nr:unnamed protein product [Schistosoma intercalatum]